MPPNSSSENTTRHLFVNFFFQHNISYHMYKLWNQFSCYPRLKPMSYYYDPFLNTYSLNCFRVYHLGEDNKITLECHWVITILQNCDGLTLWESEWAIKQCCLLKAASFLWQYVLGFTCWANLYFNFFFFCYAGAGHFHIHWMSTISWQVFYFHQHPYNLCFHNVLLFFFSVPKGFCLLHWLVVR